LSLIFLWDETTAVAEAGHSGFGTVLIHRALPSAEVEHEVRPTGVHCRIELPVSGVTRIPRP
jgi:two-component sensor histidine kinase